MERDDYPYFWLGLEAEDDDVTQNDTPIMRFDLVNNDRDRSGTAIEKILISELMPAA